MNAEEFRALGHRMVDWVADYWGRVGQYPVLSQVKPGDVLARLPEHPPVEGMGATTHWDSVFRDLDEVILPGVTHWQSPNFFAYFPAEASGPGVLGELLSAGLGVQGMLWATSPACTELETRMLDWMAEMIGLPAPFRSVGGGGGVIQGTASEATLVAMVAARRSVRDAGWRGDEPLIVYASTQAHSSVMKAAMIVGIAAGPEDRAHVRLIETDGRMRMDAKALGAAIKADVRKGGWPLLVCATVGTTSSGAVDSISDVAGAIGDAEQSLRERVAASLGTSVSPPGRPRLPWLHVDAAWAGAACVCPEHRWMLEGVEEADSIAFNPHKWLLTNFDCNCFWTRDRAAVLSALSVTPEYLRNTASESGEVIDYRDWQIPLGRRFRALKLWFVIRHYGVEGLRAHVREHVRLAERLERWIGEDPRFELAAPRSLSLVCFALRGMDRDARGRELLERINASGRAYLTHTVLDGRFVLRMAIGATLTREEHVRGVWELIRSLA